MSRRTIFFEIKNFTLIIIGACLIAIGVSFFLLPAEIATGGTPGMSMLVHFISGVPTGIAMLLINIPLLAAGFKFIDLPFATRSIVSMLLTALLIDLLNNYAEFPKISSMLLSTLYGGSIIGAGAGLILKGNASAGGTMIIARIVASFSQVKPAQTILIVDATIIVAIGFIFKDMERVLWSMLSIYATTQIIDKVITGAVKEKIIHIVSDKTSDIGKAIATELGRDGTIINGQNLTQESDKTILFVVISARRIPQLRKLVLNIDDSALMIVMEASEMMGTSQRFLISEKQS
ncbi:YitT family protein [Aliikangiella marina]|uniref:YitT family protein n=1 Tax=Aliikangiella marina TaxID=1712262 RepID=A0A545TCM6_9GAMM|nr:YitT family protein [Aliikangiella marina]TQV74974.1 YitT family protein [Aliikangiella marina]